MYVFVYSCSESFCQCKSVWSKLHLQVYIFFFIYIYKTPFNLSSELLVSVHFEFSVVLKMTAGCMSPVICLIIVSILGKLIQPSYFFCYYFHLAFLVRCR